MSKPNESKSNKDKSAGPFVAQDSVFRYCTHVVFGDSGEGFTLHVKRDEAERLVEWLNEMVTNE